MALLSPSVYSSTTTNMTKQTKKKTISAVDIQLVLAADDPGVTKMQLQKRLHKLLTRVQLLQNTYPDVDHELIENVFWYVQNLAAPGTENIDRHIFQAEMGMSFGMKNGVCVNRIYDVMRGRLPEMVIDQYIRLLTYFFTEDNMRKAEYTFSIYDLNQNGKINYAEANRFLKPSKEEFADLDDDAVAEYHRELMEILMSMLDPEGHGYFDLVRYREVVMSKPEMLECLGNYLPNVYALRRFIEDVISPIKFNVIQVYEATKDRRRRLLNEAPELDKQQLKGLYPIKITFPGSKNLEDDFFTSNDDDDDI